MQHESSLQATHSIPQAPEPCNLPEAPCSTNATVELRNDRYPHLPPMVRHQVTARGSSAEEMAQRFGAAVEALTALYAPRVAPRAERLAQLQARCLEKAVRQGNLPLAQRVLKAVALVQADAVQPSACQTVWTVTSQARPDATYLVTREGDAWVCECPDAQHRQEGDPTPCKHVLAVRLVLKMAQQEKGLK